MTLRRVAGLVMLICILTASISINSFADVKLPEIISDGMVLQRDKPVTFWGSANPGERVMVDFAGQNKESVADASGSWRIQLSPLSVSATPSIMTVSGENKIKIIPGGCPMMFVEPVDFGHKCIRWFTGLTGGTPKEV